MRGCRPGKGPECWGEAEHPLFQTGKKVRTFSTCPCTVILFQRSVFLQYSISQHSNGSLQEVSVAMATSIVRTVPQHLRNY
jgi:hypothetical protein